MSETFGVWATTAPTAPAVPLLDADFDCEIAIVGAGYTGLSTALHLAEEGQRCVVLEAQEPGWGASGRNTGWLEPNWWMKKPADIARLHGSDRGAELSRWVASGPALLDRWIAQYDLQVEIERSGLVLATERPDKAAAIEAEVRDWQALGVAHDYLDRSALQRYIPTSRYVGGILLKGGATLNPLALSRELARACLARGVEIFARTPVGTIERKDSSWQLTTPRGIVRCRRLVLATDAYTRDLWPALRGSFATWHVALIASEPYARLRELLPGGAPFADLGMSNIFTLRRAAGDRLVTTTFAPVRRSLSPAAVAGPFMRKFSKVFPTEPAPRWQYVHFGEIGLSADMMPRIVQIGPQAWTAYGYSGTGINLALLMGGDLSRLVQADRVDAATFPVAPFQPVALRGAIGLALRYVHAPVARHLVSRVA